MRVAIAASESSFQSTATRGRATRLPITFGPPPAKRERAARVDRRAACRLLFQPGMTSRRLAALTIAVAGCGAGCSGGSGTVTGDPGAASGKNYLPLSVGASWTYAVTAATGMTGQGTITVEAAENAPGDGQSALRVHTVLLDGGTIAWQQSTGAGVVRLEEKQLDQTGAVLVDKQYAPPILVLDESAAHLVSGATWTEQYMETKTPSTKKKATKETTDWTVEAVADTVTVPAGTYTCIRVRRNHTSSKTPSNTVSWYADGVGKVKETGAGAFNDETLELSAVTMP